MEKSSNKRGNRVFFCSFRMKKVKIFKNGESFCIRWLWINIGWVLGFDEKGGY